MLTSDPLDPSETRARRRSATRPPMAPPTGAGGRLHTCHLETHGGDADGRPKEADDADGLTDNRGQIAG